MNLLFDLLEPSNTPQVQSLALLALVAALLGNPLNARCFERNDGLLAIASLFKSRSTAQDVKLRVVEFLYFYLMPETPAHSAATAPTSADAQWREDGEERRRSRTVDGVEGGTLVLDDEAVFRESRGTAEKMKMLGRYLPNVEELAADLREGNDLFTGGGGVALAAC